MPSVASIIWSLSLQNKSLLIITFCLFLSVSIFLNYLIQLDFFNIRCEMLGLVVVQSLSHVWLFVTLWIAASQASLSPSPGVCSNSCPVSQWCHPTISSSVFPLSSCLQSFPASGSFLMSQLFASGGQSIGALASASVLPMSIQDWFPLGLTDLILQSKGLSSLLQHHSSKASIIQCSAFFMVQLSHPYMTTGKKHSFDYTDLCRQSNVSTF